MQQREDGVSPRKADEVIPVESSAREGLDAPRRFVADLSPCAQQEKLVLATRGDASFQLGVFEVSRHRNRVLGRRGALSFVARVRRPATARVQLTLTA